MIVRSSTPLTVTAFSDGGPYRMWWITRDGRWCCFQEGNQSAYWVIGIVYRDFLVLGIWDSMCSVPLLSLSFCHIHTLHALSLFHFINHHSFSSNPYHQFPSCTKFHQPSKLGISTDLTSENVFLSKF